MNLRTDKKKSVRYRILRSYKDTLHGRSGEIRTPGLMDPNSEKILIYDHF